ncbi:MAG: DUF1833 family protein [Treponema sp.]|nr:DUF1833 family protein [Treponema sp.]
MPNENLSPNAKKAMTAPETAEVLLHLLTISYDGQVLIRAVDDNAEIVSNGNTFYPCSFKVLLPDQTSDGNKTCRLQIDNTDIAIYREIKAAALRSRNADKNIECDAAVIMASEPDNYIEGPLHFILRNINADTQSISGELFDSYMHDRKFTTLTYNPKDFPGMFW